MKLKFQKENNIFSKTKNKKEKNLLKIMIFFLIIIYLLIFFLIIFEWANKGDTTIGKKVNNLVPNIVHGGKNKKHPIPQIIHPPPIITTKKFDESESTQFLERKIEKIDKSSEHFYEIKENGNKFESKNDLIYDI